MAYNHKATLLICYTFLFLSDGDVISKSVNCVNQQGDDPTLLDKWSDADCPDGYTVTSCGIDNIGGTSDAAMILGGYINGNGCRAQTSCTTCVNVGNRVYARCCAFDEDSITYSTGISGTADDTAQISLCSLATEELIGCSGRHQLQPPSSSYYTWFDGVYVSNGSTLGDTNETFSTQNMCITKVKKVCSG